MICKKARSDPGFFGVERWHYDLWFQIIKAALAERSAEVGLAYHPALSLPAMSRYGATTPEILRWMKGYNSGTEYRDQVKPFGFLSAFQARRNLQAVESDGRSNRRVGRPVKPIAPFNKDPRKAASKAFDRETSTPIDFAILRSYASALAQYHLSPEHKFHNGDFLESGRTERRRVKVTDINHIGKEANNLEKQFFLGRDSKEQIEYGNINAESVTIRLKRLCEQMGEREAAQRVGVSRMSLRKAMSRGVDSMSVRLRRRLALMETSSALQN